jgi:inositol-1,3,4-trisphosphate 5/6-kinase/inositol-tetrakisphosphate 1-kinase
VLQLLRGGPHIPRDRQAHGSQRERDLARHVPALQPRGPAQAHPPLVLQEFVYYGGVIFKVYVASKYVKCVRRKSLPDVDEDQVSSTDEPLPFSQISNMVSKP